MEHKINIQTVRNLTSFKIRLSELKSVSVCQLYPSPTGQKRTYGMLNCKQLTEDYLVKSVCQDTAIMCVGRHILAASDTTDMDYSRRKKRIKGNTGLGPIGDHFGYGYMAHASIGIDAHSGAICGLLDLQMSHRESHHSSGRILRDVATRRAALQRKVKLSRKEAKELADLKEFSLVVNGIEVRTIRDLAIEQKETMRWITGCQNSALIAQSASMITHVMDREGDLYETHLWIPKGNEHVIVRCKSERKAITLEGTKRKVLLANYREELPELGRKEIKIRDRDTGKDRKVIIAIRSARVRIPRSDNAKSNKSRFASHVDLTVVYADEVVNPLDPPKTPIQWCLLTSHEAPTFESAFQITTWYSMRWIIELLFKEVKTQGFRLEDSELETGYALRKLGIITMNAAAQVLQLKHARDGDLSVPIEAVFNPADILCLRALAPLVNGNTEKSSNPFEPETLPWASWIVAVVGGWNGYQSDRRPPGNQCFHDGWTRFNAIALGYKLAAPPIAQQDGNMTDEKRV